MNKEEALKLIGENDTADWHVVPKTEHETFLTNYKETEVSKGISEHISGVHQKYDDTIKAVLNIEKPHDLKTHEFLKIQLKTLTEDIQGKETKISDLEKAVGDKSGDEALKLVKSDYEALQKKHQKTLDEFKGEKESLSKEVNKVKLMNHADHALMGIKFLSAVPEDARNALVEAAKDDAVNSASFLDNTIVFMDADGQPQRDDNLNIITMEARLKAKLKSIIDEGRVQKGVKIDPTIKKDEDGKIDVNINIPDSVKTMEGLINYLPEAGLVRGTEEYFAALKKYSEKLNLK